MLKMLKKIKGIKEFAEKLMFKTKIKAATFAADNSGEINIISMVLIIIVVIALVAIFQNEMTDIVTKMFEKIRNSMGI